MKKPVLDPRQMDDLRAQVKRLARAYTPEWRYEGTEDPGGALAEIFCHMFSQTVDRMNSIPEKFYIEFLRMIGFELPGPASAWGTMQFAAHDTVERPVPVPAGTQVFAPDRQGQNIVYETERAIQATPARLSDIYYADSQLDSIRRLDLSEPSLFFAPGEGEELQRHRFFLGENDALRLDCPARIEIELRQQVRYLESQTAQALAGEGSVWSCRHGGVQIPFASVREESGRIILEKRDSLPLEPDESGVICITCEGRPGQSLKAEGITLRSEPLEPCPVQSLAWGDLPILLPEGGYCFGKRPAPYEMFYIRSDTAFSKRGAQAAVRLDIIPMVDAPGEQAPNYDFRQAIIDKRDAVAVRPDDVFISAVVWEYYNGLGWRPLETAGDKNPFSGKREGRLELTFQVPPDMAAAEVNAQVGLYIRARVAAVENGFSQYQRWIIPFIQGAEVSWRYETGIPVQYAGAENNGRRVEIFDARQVADLGLQVLETMEPAPQSMYFRFESSPDAMPLSLLFEMVGQTAMEEQLNWECWTGKGFQPVRWLDLTGALHHTGQMLLYLPEPLAETELFGACGYWLRLCRSSFLPGKTPRVAAVRLNTVAARQQQREEALFFDTGVYEAGKTVQLLTAPVQQCEVWVDERSGLSLAQARGLEEECPQRVRLEWEDSVLRRCWVRWERVKDLDVCTAESRSYELDPYEGTVRFGDGCRGKVPPSGERNIRVSYTSGGGRRGNVPQGQVNALIGALPRISDVVNITPMTGGTDRFSPKTVEELGSRLLRHRDRGAGRRDLETLIAGAFPQVRHVRCFTGLDHREQRAPGHVTVVLDSYGGSAGAEELCAQVYDYLAPRTNCCLTREGRLHIRPAVHTTVNTKVTVEVEQIDQAAETQREIALRLTRMMDEVWSSRPIGGQIRLDEIWRTVRSTPNVRTIHQILAEGAFVQEGQPRLVPLEQETRLPYAVADSGVHLVQVR